MQTLMAQAQNNPALAQALMSGQLQPPTPGQGIMAAPGTPAIPPTPQASPAQMAGAMGLNPRPQGIGPGMAPGVRRQGVEEGIQR